jgi:hypothetical protein
MADLQNEPRTPDAVILVPGIAGSELIDPKTDDLVWGLRLKLLERILLTGEVFDRLRDERLVVGDLLKVRCFLPGFGRFDPYTKLADVLRQQVCADPSAFAAYPYDWRRPLHETASGLAGFAHDHLATWRRHPKGSAEARVCFVAHSMGGLLSRYATNAGVGLDPDHVALILTLGTPFGGSVKAARAISNGNVLPGAIRARQVRDLLRATPSVYDLLPNYPSLTNDPGRPGATRPTVDDFTAIGGERDLADLAANTRARLETKLEQGPEPTPVTPLMGSAQPTEQSFSIDAGGLSVHRRVDGRDWGGDGTVYTGAAYPKGQDSAHALPQTHGPLAKSPEGIEWVKAMIEHRTIGPPQGDGIGLDVPETAVARTPIPFTVLAPTMSGVTVTITDSTGRTLPPPRLRPTSDQGALQGELALTRPGLYEVSARGGGFSAVVTDVLVTDPTDS